MTAPPRRPVLLGTAAALLLLLLAAPGPGAALGRLRAAGEAADPYEPLVAAAALAAWALALWLAVVVLLTVGGRLPGLLGRAAAAVSRRIAPAAVRRAVEVALGLTVAVGVLGASPAAAATAPGTGSTTPATAVSLDWAAPAGTGTTTAPALDWAAPAGTGTTAAPALDGAGRPGSIPVAGPATTTPAQDLDWPAGQPREAAEPVVVEPGDTLWALAEESLQAAGATDPTDAQVAQAWPSWWAANREAVGDDPDLLQPGTQLTPPSADSTGGSPRSSDGSTADGDPAAS